MNLDGIKQNFRNAIINSEQHFNTQQLGVIFNNYEKSLNDFKKQCVTNETEELYLNMQYYMEYCKVNVYVTPHEWLEKYKHF